MQVTFYENGKCFPCLFVQQVSAEFTAGGVKRLLPAVYHFEAGLIFDILTILDEAEVRAFYENYKKLEERGSLLSDVQRTKLEEESPCQEVQIQKLYLNHGVGIESFSYSAWHALPFGQEELHDALLWEMREIKAAYAPYLEDASCFSCQRVQVKTTEKWTENQVRSLCIETLPVYRGEILKASAEAVPGETRCLSFTDPFTEQRHHMYIYDVERTETEELEMAFYTAKYELIPKLPEEERLLFDTSLSYLEGNEKKEAGKEADKKIAKGVGAVSIIGGDSGPTSIFLAGKIREKKSRFGGEPQPCFSKPFPAGEQNIGCFAISGIERMIRKEEWIQVLGGKYEDISSY